ncbi:lysine--tRNA ligase [Candidatus Similichlamydia laticola]|uniref:Lysine--tRNA ligase n=1 Tax=Candidatus Similichlamydia laticola TaxID=2170265 RepID=A0A369KC29_9BACT|nr:lysine--tRNA ligase [Candidatus Similichlamydia laticola]RDB31468.1 Lysyl-tRNA synthetase (class II) [Candidatus Similichlamydia laticola]
MSECPFENPPPDYAVRLQKLEQLRALGVDPYPHESQPTHTLESLGALRLEELPHVDSIDFSHAPSVLAGRVLLHRHMGRLLFVHIHEGSSSFQLLFTRGSCYLDPLNAEQSFEVIKKLVDLGDWLEATGYFCKTRKEEPSLLVSSFRLLCKSLLPLPDKHNKLANKELILRKRWLDLTMNPDSFRRFEMRFQIIRSIRHFFEQEGFLEVETPILQSHYGGAEAKPFISQVEALKQRVFLRISLEIPLKKLLVGGMNRVFELNKVFRNEGIDRTHNPEFTLLEAYAAYWDYNKMMNLVERLFKAVAQSNKGTTLLVIQEKKIDLGRPWKRLTMKESIRLYAGFDVDEMDDNALIEAITSFGVEIESHVRGLLVAQLFEVAVEKKLLEPHHILDHPIETTPLCKPIRKQKDPKGGVYVERFESFIGGEEICNSYSELNDPLLQSKLLQEQQRTKNENHEIDLEFLESIYQGMPPAGGIGIGIDRMVMLLTEAPHIKDVLFFPMMRSI